MSDARDFHVDDVVAFKHGDSRPDALVSVGYIDRTHGDVDSHEPSPATRAYGGMVIERPKSLPGKAFWQFLEDGVPPKGYALVLWQTQVGAELVAEKDLELLDRAFTAGEIVVKVGSKNAMAGTVISVRKTCSLLGLCEAKELKSGKTLRAAWLPSSPDDEEPLLEQTKEGPVLLKIPAKELTMVHQYNEGDFIIYKNWVGRIRECFDEITVRLSDNGVVRLKDSQLGPINDDPGERLSVGSLVKTKKGTLRLGHWIFGAYSPNVTPVGVVVDVSTQECQVDWLRSRPEAGNSVALSPPHVMLDKDDLDSGQVQVYDLNQRSYDYIQGDTRVASDLDVEGGLRVRFRDIAAASVKYNDNTTHGKLERLDRRETLGYDMNVFTIISTRTEVDVQWTDLTVTEELATALAPDYAVDDDVVYPGELVCSNEQKADGVDGTIRPVKVGIVQQVSISDRIAHIKWCKDHTLSFLDSNLMHHVPDTYMGTPLEDSEEVSFYDIKAPESINRRRGDFVFLPERAHIDTQPSATAWIGEVVDVTTSGSTVVRLGAVHPVREVSMPTEATTLLLRASDMENLANDMNDDGMSFSSGSDELADDMEDDVGLWYIPGLPGDPAMPVDVEDDDWSTASEDEHVDNTEAMDTDTTASPIAAPAVQDDLEGTADHSIPRDISSTTPTITPGEPLLTIEDMNLPTLKGYLPPYEVLETAVPSNHPYASTLTASGNRMRDIRKEHKILSTATNLPSGIFVRTWESRLDLLRILFVGPVGTPYEYSPFVVDILLGLGFPVDAPVAHFHSWSTEGTGMQGRVNPNLYEDGKICLSLLGTWAGDDTKGEGWVAGKSSILQLLVSILGLVLVKEPYYSKLGQSENFKCRRGANVSLQTRQGMSRFRDFLHRNQPALSTLSVPICALARS